ncbi:IS5 family transposase [Streptomyces genisteinicus]|uniref:IS5 family transposase n=1 Tax=Streptomyces genisteinicus TaxID=2768068 RepID=A0A7H0HZM6_9ACTN|nr:IS5 family transposase [Streptomyces genisteinicus]QNP62029.1 IS5 family transposase [Streptomyces genisteinicus]QNP63865.1 IS5 family transposase [Streptomyces genisteinicus]QNP64194.1 IS5 family transposase [Streptomyces genisteinicus]QNP65992.1 IS5 family transposase [Streptomyces genisteinicus]
MGRGDLTNHEWSLLEPHLPPKGRRGGRWNDHRTVINGILFRVRTGVPWRDLPERYGPWKTVYERHRRWSADGTWDRILQSVQADADLAGRIDWSMVGVDSTSCRAHQHAAGARKAKPRVPKKRTTPRHHRPDEGLGRSRGGLTCKIHLAGEGGCRPMAFLVTPGQWGDAPQMVEVLDRIRVPRPLGGRPRTRPEHVSGDKAYSSRRNRRYLRRRRIRHTIPEPKDQQANRRRKGREGGRPTGFHRDHYRRRNEVERTINRLKNSRAVATRYDKRAYVFHGTVTAAAIRLWLRQ